MAVPSHASPHPDRPPVGDATTGEVRIPLELWAVDRPEGAADLVLSRTEAEVLHAQLAALLAGQQSRYPAEAFG
jgi:hypothetical protein